MQHPALRVDLARSGTSAVLALSGDLDLATVDELTGCARELRGVRQLVVDASALDFLDLAGTRGLLALQRDLRAGGGTLVLRRPSRAVQRLLALLDPDGRLALED